MKKKDYMWDYRNPYEWMDRTMRGTLPPMIITCAITGGVQGKEYNENLPETAEEQADQVYEAYKAGAVSVHVHARVPDNLSLTTSNPEDYSRVNRLIRERCPDIIINNTTGGGPWLTTEQRMCCLLADPPPDMVSGDVPVGGAPRELELILARCAVYEVYNRRGEYLIKCRGPRGVT